MRVRLVALIFLASACAAAQTDTLNLSRDLVRLGIAATNLAPNNPTVDARPSFQAAVQYVASHPVRILTVDPGNYYFLTSQNPQTYLTFYGLSNLTVDLAGSAIYFNGAFLQGFAISRCRNVTLANFQTDFVNAPYTHVQIASVNSTARTVAYQTLAGWPDPSAFNGVTTPFGTPVLWGVVFRGGILVPGTTRMQVGQPIANGTLQLVQDHTPWTQSAALATMLPGDTFVVTQRGGQSPILVVDSDSIVVSNVSIHGSSAMAIQMNSVSNSTVDSVRVTPRPDTGLISSNADGIHFTYSKQGNHIRRSYVTATLDDALAMDSLYLATVSGKLAPRHLRVNRSYYMRFANGTPINFVDSVTTNELPGATIVSQNPPDSGVPLFNGEVDLTFDRDLPDLAVGAGMMPGEAGARGAGSSVEDNVVEDIPFGRGIWVGGNDGVTIERNVIRRTSSGAIVVSQDTKSYPGPPAHDIAIRSNVIEGNLGPAASGSGTEIAVASIIVESTDNTFAFASAAPNTNISILNNYIADSGRAGLWIGQLNGGTISGNVIVRWNSHPELPLFGVSENAGRQLRQDFQQAIVVRGSQNVGVANNVTNSQSGLAGAVTLNPGAASYDVSAASDSLAVQANVPGLAWTAASDSAWLTLVSGTAGTGPGMLAYTVAANDTGWDRSGVITIAGTTYRVDQGADTE
ncbi:MAG: right-handed parallel beta-helix repeat-containing protein [Acidobacteriota bacterium]|nr:right-handed parallel beta-helix repeat-containing protein [Acidobacteriota bacterium]